MKRAGKILLCLASGLACTAIPRAADGALPKNQNPYALVVTRNVFGLNPPVVPAPVSLPVDPPPKITPNGILSIMGHSQVLFKVANARPGQPAKDDYYNLSEGQSQDDIEVTHIDEKNGLVTFNNHGTVQELPLIATSASGGAPSAPAGGITMPGAIPAPAAMVNGGNGNVIPYGANGALGGRNPNLGNGGNYPGANLPAVPMHVNPINQQPAMSMEVQTLMIEAQRLQAQNEGDPIAKILPPTEATPPPDSDDGSTPPVP